LIQQISRDFPIVKDNATASDQYQGWIDSVTNLLNALEVIEGAGSPEGVVYADKKKLYFNTTGGAGTLIYLKSTAKTLNTGWVAVG
jgi:hypothetical protein